MSGRGLFEPEMKRIKAQRAILSGVRLVIADPCDEPWDAMPVEAGGRTRRCAVCDKPVHDLSARTEAQALGLLALFGSGGLCVRFLSDEAGRVQHAPAGPRRAAVAAGIVAAAVAAGCKPPPPAAVAPSPTASAIAETPDLVEPAPAAEPAPSADAAKPCPDGMLPGDGGACEVPKRVIVEAKGDMPIVPMAHFAYGSGKVRPESKTMLDGVAEVMRDHPEITKVAVVGHTSNDEKAGARLGEVRARATIAALGARGVDAGRLVAEGHGSEQPLANNATQDGRALNRRVQFRILERSARPAP